MRQDWLSPVAVSVSGRVLWTERQAVLRLPGSWIWDFWFADDGCAYHVFFLKAPRRLGDPELRHNNVAIGHATSEDLIHWTAAADVLTPSESPAFDDLVTWTGSVVRGPDSRWFMFYTGGTNTPAAVKQRIGVATSADLYTWHRHPASPVRHQPRRPAGQRGSVQRTPSPRPGRAVGHARLP